MSPWEAHSEKFVDVSVSALCEKRAGGEGHQGLGPEGLRAPVNSRGCAQHRREVGKLFFQIRAKSINLRS